jgi:hypothetical protein
MTYDPNLYEIFAPLIKAVHSAITNYHYKHGIAPTHIIIAVNNPLLKDKRAREVCGKKILYVIDVEDSFLEAVTI